jgi:hypothetical protein
MLRYNLINVSIQTLEILPAHAHITHDQKPFYKSKFLSLIAIDHAISLREPQERLDKMNLHLDRDYIGKLYDEIIVERSKRMDRQLFSHALSSFEDTMTEIVRVA